MDPRLVRIDKKRRLFILLAIIKHLILALDSVFCPLDTNLGSLLHPLPPELKREIRVVERVSKQLCKSAYCLTVEFFAQLIKFSSAQSSHFHTKNQRNSLNCGPIDHTESFYLFPDWDEMLLIIFPFSEMTVRIFCITKIWKSKSGRSYKHKPWKLHTLIQMSNLKLYQTSGHT